MEHTFPSESFQRKNRTTFSEVSFIPEIFQWNEPKTCVPFTSNRNFRNFLVNGKRPGCPELFFWIAMFLVTSSIVINMPTRTWLAVETITSFVPWLANLNIKRNVTSMFENKKYRYSKPIIMQTFILLAGKTTAEEDMWKKGFQVIYPVW